MRRRFFKKSKKGFMLIELSIALVVIGLLFAGVSGGTALIENAKIRATLSQIESIKNAVLMFNAEYGLPPGGLQNTVDYFPNAMYRDHPTDPHTCVREGNKSAIAAEGTGGSKVHGTNHWKLDGSKKSPITAIKISEWTNEVSILDTDVNISNIAMCQLHTGRYIDLPAGSKVSTGNVKPGIHAPKVKMAGQASIVLISDDKRSMAYSMLLGDTNTPITWNGKASFVEGNIHGTLLKKLDLKLSTGKPDTGDFVAHKKVSGSTRVTGGCEYKEKAKNCLAIYKLSI